MAKVYTYTGPVTSFGKCIDPCWVGQTQAVSEQQARNNLTYQYKKKHGLEARSNIGLPGALSSQQTMIIGRG